MDKDIMKLLGSAFQLPSVINNVNHLENNNLEEKLPSMDKFSRTKLLLSLEQMVQENYPVPLKGILARR
jgi:RNA exonuclease 1